MLSEGRGSRKLIIDAQEESFWESDQQSSSLPKSIKSMK